MQKEKEYEFKFKNNKIELYDLILSGLFDCEEVKYGVKRDSGLLSIQIWGGIEMRNMKFDFDDLTLYREFFDLIGARPGAEGVMAYHCKLARTDYVVQFEILEFNREILKIRKK